MNQAIKFAEVENGDVELWVPQQSQDMCGDFGQWYNKYLAKHISSISKDYVGSGKRYYEVAFSDGSGFVAYIPQAQDSGATAAYVFYCTDFKYCAMRETDTEVGVNEAYSYDGIHTFLFAICNNGKFVASSICGYSFSRDVMLEGCANKNPHLRHLCTALIQYDGWKISKDYPWKRR